MSLSFAPSRATSSDAALIRLAAPLSSSTPFNTEQIAYKGHALRSGPPPFIATGDTGVTRALRHRSSS